MTDEELINEFMDDREENDAAGKYKFSYNTIYCLYVMKFKKWGGKNTTGRPKYVTAVKGLKSERTA